MKKNILTLLTVIMLITICAISSYAYLHDPDVMNGHAHEVAVDEYGVPLTAPTSFDTKPEHGEFFTCPVSGGVFEVEEHTIVKQHEGKYYAFCCGGCAQDFDKDPDKFINNDVPKTAHHH